MRAKQRFGISVLLGVICAAAAASAAEVRSRYIDGAGGVPLNVIEAGDPDQPTLVFIHGMGQSHLSWMFQLQSSLAERFHLVAFDLRGHGNSGKPWRAEDYAAPTVWAEDLARVIRATTTKPPVVIAWSYGTWVAVDYLATHDPESLSGLMLVGGLGGLGPMTPTTDPGLAQRGKRISEGVRSGYLENGFAAGEEIGAFFMRRPVDETWMRRTGAANALLPPYVRAVVTQRSFDHSTQRSRVRMPTMLVVGSEDPQIEEADARALAAQIPSASVSVFEGSGHLPFAEDADRFNQQLADFATDCFSSKSADAK